MIRGGERRVRRGSRAIVGTVLVLVGLGACGTPDPVRPDLAMAPMNATQTATTRLDPATILGASVTGDRLAVRVQYGGGCREHTFSLLYSGVFRESYPVQTDLRLAHDADGDMCRALLSDSLVFDLKPLRDAYRAAYQAERGAISIHLFEPTGRSPVAARLLYEF